LAVIGVVLMSLAVPGIRGTLMVLDARRRAGSPPPRTQERWRHERPALHDVAAADWLALTWLDNGGAPAAVTSVIRQGNAEIARIPASARRRARCQATARL